MKPNLLIRKAKPMISSKQNSDDLPPNLSTQKAISKEIANKNNRNMFVKKKIGMFLNTQMLCMHTCMHRCHVFKLILKLSRNSEIC